MKISLKTAEKRSTIKEAVRAHHTAEDPGGNRAPFPP